MKQQNFTIADVAKLYRCSHSSVLSLVRSGALTAIDISTFPAGRSRYIVTADALAEFEERRTVRPPSPKRSRRAKAKPTNITEFFK